MIKFSSHLKAMGIAFMVVFSSWSVHAAGPDGYPKQPIKIIVPWPAGGAADFVTRTVGQRLSERVGQPVLVENKPGAGTTIATEAASRAPADGYTLLLASSNNCVNVTLFPDLKIDIRTAFTPITNVVDAPNILVVNSTMDVSTVKDLVSLARSKPGILTYGSSGNGSASHMAAELFKMMAAVDIRGIPYKGAPPAITDLIGGEISMVFTVIPVTLPHTKSGKLRALGVGSRQRMPQLPDVPAIAEILPGFEMGIWYGLVAPAKTPAPIVKYLHEEIAAILREPVIIEKLQAQGTVTIGNTPKQFGKTIAEDVERYGQLIRAAKIRAE